MKPLTAYKRSRGLFEHKKNVVIQFQIRRSPKAEEEEQEDDDEKSKKTNQSRTRYPRGLMPLETNEIKEIVHGI